MPYDTEKEARKAGKELLKRMKGKRWKLEVWNNLGWHCMVRNGPVQVHLDNYCGKDYSCLISDNLRDPSGGNIEWTTQDSKHFTDPNKAVAHELKSARKYLNRWTKAVEFAENTIKEKP